MATKSTQAWERQQELLDEEIADGDISEPNGEALKAYLNHERGHGKAESTLTNYCSRLRCVSRASPMPLTEMTQSELEALINDIRDGSNPEVKDGGIQVNNHQTALRRFGSYHEVAWNPDEVEIDPRPGRDLEPEDLLYRKDIDALLDACGMDIRYKALITMGLATGQRIDGLRTLRIKHITWDGPTGSLTLNSEEADLKGASGDKPLLFSKHYLKEWLEIHPYKDNPEAGVFCADPRMNSRNEGNTEPLKYASIRQRLKRLADTAGIEKDVYPHLFRHTAITRLVLENVGEQQIKNMVGWSAESSQFSTYVTLADKLANDGIREALGLPTSESGVPKIGIPTLQKCLACGEELPEEKHRCPSCHEPITNTGQIKKSDEEEEAQDAFDEVLQEAKDDPEKAVELIDALRDELT